MEMIPILGPIFMEKLGMQGFQSAVWMMRKNYIPDLIWQMP